MSSIGLPTAVELRAALFALGAVPRQNQVGIVLEGQDVVNAIRQGDVMTGVTISEA